MDPRISQEKYDENPYQDFNLSSRVKNPYTTTAREEPQYKEYVQKIVLSLNGDQIVMDLGCGSGRFTKFLLSLGVKKIIAVDLSLLNLRKLETDLTNDELANVLLLNTNALYSPIAPACLDVVFAIGVFHTLPRNQFQLACEEAYILLRTGGLLVNSVPTFEGALIYALVCHDIDEFLKTAINSTKAVDIRGNKSARVHVYTENEVEKMLTKVGFTLKEKYGIPIYPSIIFGGVLPMKQVPDETKDALVDISDALKFLKASTSRVIFYVSEKRHVIECDGS